MRRPVAASRAAEDALIVLGQQIRMARLKRGWSLADVGSRLSIDRRTVSGIEVGSPAAAIGTVFSVAVLVGVDLFGLDAADLALARRRGAETLALLPARVRKPLPEVDDGDFDF